MKYDIKEQLNGIIETYESQAIKKKLVFRIQVDPSLPAAISGDVDTIISILRLLLDQSFACTQAGKIVLKISDGRVETSSSWKLVAGTKLPVRFDIFDTSDRYDSESDNVKNAKAKMIFLDSYLSVKNKDKLGANASFIVSLKAETSELMEEYSYVVKPQKTQDQESGGGVSESPIAGVDMDKGLGFVQGNQTIYERFLVEYVRSKEDFLKRLDDFAEAGDWANYRIVAHSVKSSSYSLGADALGDLAKEMEFAAKDLKADLILRKNSQLMELLREIGENVEAYLRAQGIPYAAKADTKKEQLLAAFDDFDQEKALEILDEIVEVLTDQAGGTLDEEKRALIEGLREHIENLDYFSASELAEEL